MGLFDLFKKKDAEFYLNRGRKALEQHRWVAARDDFKDGLHLKGTSPETTEGLQAGLVDANRQICELNIREAALAQRDTDFIRAVDCLETAKIHATDSEERARIEVLFTEVREARAQASKKVDVLQPVDLRDIDEEAAAELEEFEAYLAGLVPDVAELYSALRRDFARAYVAMNGGDPRPMLNLMNRMEPQSEEQQALFAFERARALLMIQQPDQALVMLDVALSIRGSEPIFLTNHPSIAFLRFEAFAMLNRLEDGVDALKEGLLARPDQSELQTLLASALIELKRFDEAEPLLVRTLSCNGGDPQVHILKARLLMERGDPNAAIEALESGIKSCGCGPSSLPNPLLARSLADLYLVREEQPRRVETLLNQLFRAQNGEGEWIDHLLRARYLKWQGDTDLARVSLRKALDGLEDPADPRRKQLEAMLAS